MKYLVTEIDNGKRLDVFLSKNNAGISRNQINKLIPMGVLVNGCKAKKSTLLKTRDIVEINKMNSKLISIDQEPIRSQEGNIDIVFENNDFIIVKKRKGILVHPDKRVLDGTLINHLKFYFEQSKFINNLPRLGIIYRLDKVTSGFIIVAKNERFYKEILKQQKEHSIVKVYKAEVKKVSQTPKNFQKLINDSTIFEVNGLITRDKIFRAKRVSELSVITNKAKGRVFSQKMVFKYPLVFVRIITGRTHQIRASLKSLGYVIEGDKLYGDVTGDYEKIKLECVFISFNYSNKSYSFGEIDELWASKIRN